MAEKARKLAPTTLLILLAVASFAAATVTVTNITRWTVIARYAPIVKYAGDDVETGWVTVGYDVNGNVNRTVITLVGFKGDPTKYDSVLNICLNTTVADDKAFDVYLVWNGTVSGDWSNVDYVKLWIEDKGPMLITSSGASPSEIGPVTLKSGVKNCAVVSAEVLVKPNAPSDDITLVTFEVNVEAEHPPSP
jgi:hypothetical protein